MRPEGIHGLTPKSVKKKLKQPSFAAAVNRDDVRGGRRAARRRLRRARRVRHRRARGARRRARAARARRGRLSAVVPGRAEARVTGPRPPCKTLARAHGHFPAYPRTSHTDACSVPSPSYRRTYVRFRDLPAPSAAAARARLVGPSPSSKTRRARPSHPRPPSAPPAPPTAAPPAPAIADAVPASPAPPAPLPRIEHCGTARCQPGAAAGPPRPLSAARRQRPQASATAARAAPRRPPRLRARRVSPPLRQARGRRRRSCLVRRGRRGLTLARPYARSTLSHAERRRAPAGRGTSDALGATIRARRVTDAIAAPAGANRGDIRGRVPTCAHPHPGAGSGARAARSSSARAVGRSAFAPHAHPLPRRPPGGRGPPPPTGPPASTPHCPRPPWRPRPPTRRRPMELPVTLATQPACPGGCPVPEAV